MPMTSTDGHTNATLLARRRSVAPHRAHSGPKPEPELARSDVSLLTWWDAFDRTGTGSVEAERMLDARRGEST